MPRSRYAITAIAAVIVLPSAWAIQLVLRAWGPASSVPTSSDVLTPQALQMALREPGERLTLLAWWGIAGLLALLLSWCAPRYVQMAAGRPSHRILNAALILFAGLSLTMMLAAALWGHDPDGTWQGIGFSGLLAGALTSALISAVWLLRRRFALVISIVGLAALIPMIARGLLQSPNAIGDPYHSAFVAEEIAAVAAGRFPLSDFIPQYSSLLGYPIAPLIKAWPSHASFIVVSFMLTLQVVCLAIVVALPVLLAGRRFLAPVALVALPPVVVSYAGGYSPVTSFSAFPIRPFLPLVSILLTFLVLRGSRRLAGKKLAGLIAVAALAGTAALNNPDHGLPSLAAILGVVVLSLATWPDRVKAIAAVLIGCVAPFIGYELLGSMTGHPVDWSMLVAYARFFGTDGWGATPMEPFGLHVAFVAEFSAAVITGAVLITRSPAKVTTFAYRQGLLLLLTGGWALLTVAYFIGRSVPVVAVGAFALPAGLVGAAFLPLLAVSLRSLKSQLPRAPLPSALALLVGMLMVTCLSGSLVIARQPTMPLREVISGALDSQLPPVESQRAILINLMSSPGDPKVADALRRGRVVQVLSTANMLALTAGMPSASITNGDDYLWVSPFIIDYLCERAIPPDAEFVLASRATVTQLVESPACLSRMALGFGSRTSADYQWVPVRKGAG